MIHHHVVLLTKNPRDVVVGARVQAHAVGDDARFCDLLDRLLGVVAQVLRIADIHVGRFAIGDDDQQFLGRTLQMEVVAGMPDRRAHAGGQLTGHAGQLGLRHLVPVLVEILETVVLDVMTAIRAEAMDGEWIADLVDRVGQQHAGLLREFPH